MIAMIVVISGGSGGNGMVVTEVVSMFGEFIIVKLVGDGRIGSGGFCGGGGGGGGGGGASPPATLSVFPSSTFHTLRAFYLLFFVLTSFGRSSL